MHHCGATSLNVYFVLFSSRWSHFHVKKKAVHVNANHSIWPSINRSISLIFPSRVSCHTSCVLLWWSKQHVSVSKRSQKAPIGGKPEEKWLWGNFSCSLHHFCRVEQWRKKYSHLLLKVKVLIPPCTNTLLQVKVCIQQGQTPAVSCDCFTIRALLCL